MGSNPTATARRFLRRSRARPMKVGDDHALAGLRRGHRSFLAAVARGRPRSPPLPSSRRGAAAPKRRPSGRLTSLGSTYDEHERHDCRPRPRRRSLGRPHDRRRARGPGPLARSVPRHRAAQDRRPRRRRARPPVGPAVDDEPDRDGAAPDRGRGVLAPRRLAGRAGRPGLLLHPRQPGRRLRRRRPRHRRRRTSPRTAPSSPSPGPTQRRGPTSTRPCAGRGRASPSTCAGSSLTSSRSTRDTSATWTCSARPSTGAPATRERHGPSLHAEPPFRATNLSASERLSERDPSPHISDLRR